MAGKNQSKTLSDAKIKAMKVGEELTDSLPGRGAGSLLFKRPSEQPPTVFYRYRFDGKTKLLRVGVYKSKPSVPGLTLEALRARGRELATILAEHGDPRSYLEELERNAELEKVQAKRIAEIEAAQGSFGDLFRDYIESRRGKVRDDQIDEFERILRVDLIGRAPAVMQMKARDVRPHDIQQLLTPIWTRGAKRQAGKVRSFLRAAFKFGLKDEYSVGRASRLSYALESNPVDVVPVDSAPKAVERALSDEELRHFWNTITDTKGVGFVMSRFFQFAIALGGQRVEQVAREPWSSYDFDANTVRIIDAKGRGGVPRVHLVPLTARALAILREVRAVTGDSPWPWSSNSGQSFVTTSFAHAIADWRRSPHSVLNGVAVEHFTPRDLRRSCTQLMQRHGVDDRLSDHLQSHGQVGVVGTHYRNNPKARLPQSRKAIIEYEQALARVLDVVEVEGVLAHWMLVDGLYRAEVEGSFCFVAETEVGLKAELGAIISLQAS
ncbi:tyrosine-type recombinase/integrase [Pseudomonas shirazica]|uniref:tyrosine-type recombinase/integrase n=1 Tax=Pseudomonas shirazica TaxID=1940636 RepID=UPI003525C450